jgi:hypothetical protein
MHKRGSGGEKKENKQNPQFAKVPHCAHVELLPQSRLGLPMARAIPGLGFGHVLTWRITCADLNRLKHPPQ